MSILRGLLLWCLLVFPAWAQTGLLAPEQAFRPRLERAGDQVLAAHFEVAPGYYLYRDRFVFATAGAALHADFPAGIVKNDPSFGRVETYPHPVTIPLRSDGLLDDGLMVTMKFQGCSESGVCYPPQTVTLRPGQSVATGMFASLPGWFETSALPADMSLRLQVRPSLFSGSFVITLGLFFLAGIGLSFTACMYPLLPIVSGIVLQGAKTGGRAIALTCSYIQGMALTYTAAGLLAAASGAFLAVTLQQPWVIAGFALFFVAMALAMFGVFSLELPGGLQSRLNDWAARFPGGRFVSVFVMGMISALIIGPCVAPPLVAVLAYLGQTGDVFLGGTALYFLALGLGTPLLVIGVFGSAALPRLSGKVLRGVRMMFGVALLGMAVWVARPLWLERDPVPGLSFRNVASAAELDSALAQAKGQPVLLDFYADWCASCLEFERNTLTDPQIQHQLKGFVLLRADITQNTPSQRELLRRFGLYGPPAFLFYNQEGRLNAERMIGETDAKMFGALLEKMRQ